MDEILRDTGLSTEQHHNNDLAFVLFVWRIDTNSSRQFQTMRKHVLVLWLWHKHGCWHWMTKTQSRHDFLSHGLVTVLIKRKASGGRTQHTRTVHVCKDTVPTQTVKSGGFEAMVKNTAFTVCDAKPQTLHTKQNPELVQQLSWERGANGTHTLTHSISCAVW